MIELKKNHQVCYYHPNNAFGVAMNLLNFGYGQFSNTFLYQNREILKNLVEKSELLPKNVKVLADFTFNNLIDSIKIHICLENYLKAVFLIQNIVIHRIDKTIHLELHKKQREKPVYVNELLKNHSWIDNEKIDLPTPEFRMQISGILKNTIGTNILMKPGYLDFIGFNKSTSNLFQPYFEYRNNLHYYTEESFTLTPDSYTNLQRIINFVNLNIVSLQNEMVEKLGKGKQYELKSL